MGLSMSSTNLQQRHLSSFLTFFPILLFDPSGAHPFVPTRGALSAENDAERAARAAPSIQRALADLNCGNARAGKPELVARIGLETGPAVVDAAGEIYGDVTNIAARVQALADAGAVLITAQVQRQVAGLFVVEEGGCH